MPPAPYRVARVVTVAITGFSWWLVLLGAGWVFAGGNHTAFVSKTSMMAVASLTLLAVPFFTTHGVLTGMLDGLLRERLLPPEGASDPEARARSPWRAATFQLLSVGVVAAVLGYAWASRQPAGTWTPGAFAWRLAQLGTLLCVVVAWLASGGAFVHETRVPPEHRRFAGDLDRYLRARHVLPHGVANTLINGVVAFALFPAAVVPGALVAAKLVVGDTLITFFVLTALLVPGVTTHARVDSRWGVMPREAAGEPLSMSDAVLSPLLASFGFVLIAALFFWLLPFRLDVYQWALYRAVLFGGYSAWLVSRVARAGLHSKPAA